MERLLTVREAAKVLKTNANFVYSLLEKGQLPYLKIGSLKIRESALDEFIRSNEIISSPSKGIRAY